MVSALILVPGVTPDTIVKLHDQLSNELTTVLGKWKFSFKIFRNNADSKLPELANASSGLGIPSETKFLYTLNPSYMEDNCIMVINKQTSCVFSTGISSENLEKSNYIEEAGETLDIPDVYLEKGVTTGHNSSFDFFVNQKLKSLWIQKQSIKGDSGNIYSLENGKIIIRTSNVFLHGNFRGLVIQLEINDEVILATAEILHGMFERIIAKYKIPRGHMSCNVLDINALDKYGDLCLQYSEILNF